MNTDLYIYCINCGRYSPRFSFFFLLHACVWRKHWRILHMRAARTAHASTRDFLLLHLSLSNKYEEKTSPEKYNVSSSISRSHVQHVSPFHQPEPIDWDILARYNAGVWSGFLFQEWAVIPRVGCF